MSALSRHFEDIKIKLRIYDDLNLNIIQNIEIKSSVCMKKSNRNTLGLLGFYFLAFYTS